MFIKNVATAKLPNLEAKLKSIENSSSIFDAYIFEYILPLADILTESEALEKSFPVERHYYFYWYHTLYSKDAKDYPESL